MVMLVEKLMIKLSDLHNVFSTCDSETRGILPYSRFTAQGLVDCFNCAVPLHFITCDVGGLAF